MRGHHRLLVHRRHLAGLRHLQVVEHLLKLAQQFLRRLQGVLVARTYVMMDYDCRVEQLEKAVALTPGTWEELNCPAICAADAKACADDDTMG